MFFKETDKINHQSQLLTKSIDDFGVLNEVESVSLFNDGVYP